MPQLQERAWATWDIKAYDDDLRIVEGIASTPSPDRGGDVMDPKGAQFVLPLPFLWFHNAREPIGHVVEATITEAGIYIKAQIPKVETPGRLKDRVDEAWDSLKAGLVRGLSIGWGALERERIRGTSFTKYTKWIWGELSAVTIPMNVDATITSVKSLDVAASGLTSPRVTGTVVVQALKDAPAMTITEQITQWTNTRGPKKDRMDALMADAAKTGVTLDQAQADEYDALKLEIKSIDEHLARLKDAESLNVVTATPITPPTTTEDASKQRGGTPVVISVKANVPKGTAFTRFVMAKIAHNGSVSDAIRYAESRKDWMDQTPEVALALKAVVNPGTIAEPAWAAPLAVTTPMQNEFLELLRPATLIGKIEGLRRVPFNISVPVQTGGGTYAWVGEGAPKPVGNLQLTSATLGIAKAAGIIVISEELARISSPSAEAVVRNDMIKGMAEYLDRQFIDPTIVAVTNVSPASITNGASGYGTAGTSADNARTDLKKAITLMTQAGYNISEVGVIMSEANAFALASALTANGVPSNPGLTAKGGTMLGVPVYTSQAAGNVVATSHMPSILFADDGGVSIDVSREATVEMNTVPTSPISAASAYVSLWQANLIGLRAERFINWKRARTTAVVYTTATYV